MSSYQKAVLEARKKFLKLTLEQEREILKIYSEAGKQVTERLTKTKAGSLTARYLSELDKSINQYRRELSTKLSKSIKDGMEASSQIASVVQLSYFDNIAPNEDLKSTFRKMFSQLNTDVVKTLISGNYYKDGKTLNDRIWNISKKNAKDIDSLIKTNVAKGANARDLAKQLDNYINPKNRISSKPIYIVNEKGNLIKLPPPSGISYNISYQAQRLARTSLTHANTEAYIQGSKKNPFCRGLKWNLSSSHSARMHGRTDMCDDYSGRIFKPEKLPIQHPNCLCYFTQEVEDIGKSRDELINWMQGSDNSKLDKWLSDYGEEFGISTSSSKASKTFSELAVSKEEKSGIISNKGWLKASFPNEKKFNKHIEKHLHEYGDITKDEYLNIARELLASPIKGDIEGFKSELGFIFRYNKATNDFAIGRADGYISTLYKPVKGYEQWLEEIEKYKKED